MNKQHDPITYTCAGCGGTFVSTWTDSKAEQELREHWGDVPPDACVVVCEDCWQKVKKDIQSTFRGSVMYVGAISA